MSVYSLHIAVYMHTVDKAHISQAVPANVGCDVCEAKALADPVSNARNKLGLSGSIHIWVVMLVVASDDLLRLVVGRRDVTSSCSGASHRLGRDCLGWVCHGLNASPGSGLSVRKSRLSCVTNHVTRAWCPMKRDAGAKDKSISCEATI